MAGTSSQNRVLTPTIPPACDREKSSGEHQSHQGRLVGEAQPNLAPAAGDQETGIHGSDRNSYSSMTAATATRPSLPPSSTRTTLPLHRTRMLSVKVISGGRVRVNSMFDPAAIAESTKKQMPRALTSRVCAAFSCIPP